MKYEKQYQMTHEICKAISKDDTGRMLCNIQHGTGLSMGKQNQPWHGENDTRNMN